MNPFDIVHDLVTKEHIDNEICERKDYKPFLINRTLSYDDTLLSTANTLNLWCDVSKRMHFDFIRNKVPKKRRRKHYWAKGKKFENMQIVKEYYGYSNQKSLEVLSVLSDKDIKNIKNKLYRGGSS